MTDYYFTTLSFIGIYAIVALGLNIISGYTGQFHLGIAVYMGTGAYAVAMFTKSAGWWPWAAIPAAIVIATLMSAATGILALKVKEDSLSVVTIGLAFVFETLLVNLPYFGGALGVTNIPSLPFFGESEGRFFIFVMLALVFCLILNRYLVASWLGLGWESLREDDLAAEITGINVAQFKIWAFVFGGLFCGIGGVLYAYKLNYVSPSDFGFLPSVYILAMVVFGGLGTIRGPLLGAAFLTASPEIFRFVQEYRNLIYGGLLVILMMVQPEGLLGNRSFIWLALKNLAGICRDKTLRRGDCSGA